MKILKKFEGYIDDKISNLKNIKKIVTFMEKYKIDNFIIGNLDPDDKYQFEYIEKNKNEYKIEYIDYTQGIEKIGHKGNKFKSKFIKCDLLELPNNVVKALMLTISFDIETHLEVLSGDVEQFINILKKYKKPINFNTWMFMMIIENEEQTKGNSYEFQNILFSTHPEAYKAFIDACFNPNYNTELIVNPKILIKYENLLKDYYSQKKLEYEANKYNL